MLKQLLSSLTQNDVYVQLSENRLCAINVRNGDEYHQIPLVALEKQGSKTLIKAIGADAKTWVKQPGVAVINPFSHPRVLVADFQKAEKVLMHAFQALFATSWFAVSPRVVIQPMEKLEGGLTDIEIRALRELCLGAGAREVVVYVGPVVPWQGFRFDELKARDVSSAPSSP